MNAIKQISCPRQQTGTSRGQLEKTWWKCAMHVHSPLAQSKQTKASQERKVAHPGNRREGCIVFQQNQIEVLVCSPRHVHSCKPAARLIYPGCTAVQAAPPVWVNREKLRASDAVGETAANWKALREDCPFWLRTEAAAHRHTTKSAPRPYYVLESHMLEKTWEVKRLYVIMQMW